MDYKKVRKLWKLIQDIVDIGDYQEFEVAYLINEMLNNAISSEEEITDEIIDEVYNLSQNYDSLLNDYLYEDLSEIEEKLKEEE